MTDIEAFEILSEPIRHMIRKKGWESFRPIQRAAIERIMTTENHCVLSACTASGKTEAALLPILSKADFSQYGVQVLYISPLIALINDQERRLVELCQYLDISVVKWHGEAKQSVKKQLIKDPNGVVLITPESIEAMFVNHPEWVSRLFSNLRFIVVDEIHYFLGSDRGRHLQSLLQRIIRKINHRVQMVGLSATIGNLSRAKFFFCDEENTTILKDKTQKGINVSFKYYPGGLQEFPIDLIKSVFRDTYGKKALVFPNARKHVEELSVKLGKLAQKINAPDCYYAHHSSIVREVREDVERIAKLSKDQPFVICCTSTLELGIDIGNVDMIVQINSTYSVSSLIQRAGRSGRQEGNNATLFVYSLYPAGLIQALACWILYTKGEIEPFEVVSKPYDIYAHQIISILKEKSEISPSELYEYIGTLPQNKVFTKEEFKKIIDSMLNSKEQYLESLEGKLILGLEGNRLALDKDFYSMFQPEVNLRVFWKDQQIGEIDPLFIGDIGSEFFLAARAWVIEEIDASHRKVFVQPAKEGQGPKFSSGQGIVSKLVEQEMWNILFSDIQIKNLDEKSLDVLNAARLHFSSLATNGLPIYERDAITTSKYAEDIEDNDGDEESQVVVYPFWGTKINDSIWALLSYMYGDVCAKRRDEYGFLYYICEGTMTKFLDNVLKISRLTREMIDEHIVLPKLRENPQEILKFSKFGYLLPIELQVKLLYEKAFAFEEAQEELRRIAERIR